MILAIGRHQDLRRVDIEPADSAKAELTKTAISPLPARWMIPVFLLLGVCFCGPVKAIGGVRGQNMVPEPASPGKQRASGAEKKPAGDPKVVRGKRAQQATKRPPAARDARRAGKAPAPERTPRLAKSATSKRSAAVVSPFTQTTPSAWALACKEKVELEIQPARTVKQAEECEKELSQDPLIDEIRRIASGARLAMEVQRSAGLSADLFEDSYGDAGFSDLVRKSARGDSDAAYRIAQAYKNGQPGILASPRRMEQWLRFSAELGNGRASWELAEFYNYGGLVADAARFEKKAQELGYQPGARLPSRGY